LAEVSKESHHSSSLLNGQYSRKMWVSQYQGNHTWIECSNSDRDGSGTKQNSLRHASSSQITTTRIPTLKFLTV